MYEIHHLLRIKAAPSVVFEALTTQAGIASWWSEFVTAQPIVGSTIHIKFGPEYFKDLKVSELVPDKKVRWEVVQAHPEWLGTTIEFDLQEEKGGTTLRFFHSGWKGHTDMLGQCSYHWVVYLQNLKVFSEHQKKFAMNELR
jgi:uncharacterized protein YndB with AHSA1/START domain